MIRIHYKSFLDKFDNRGIGMTLDTALLKEELDGEHFRNFFYLFNAAFGESSDISQFLQNADVSLHSLPDKFFTATGNMKLAEFIPLFFMRSGKFCDLY